MMTYEEFLKANDTSGVYAIYFSQDAKDTITQIVIRDDPRQYLDVAAKAKDLHWIQISEAQSAKYYKAIEKFIENCNDNISISNETFGMVNKEEFYQGEEIINKFLDEINPNWTTKQKLAYLHYKMSELVSYVPDGNILSRDGNSKDGANARNIWKSLINKKSLCNGITSIQRTILSRIGIKTQDLSSSVHSFMLAETEEGNIITDATWDLGNSLYGCIPMYFGKTYEQIREIEKSYSNSHKLKNPPENVIEISEEELREIYYSLGYTNEDRKFALPISNKVDEINSQEFNNMQDKLTAFFNMFTQNFSEEATHLTETRKILEQCLSDLGIKEKDLTTKFVYAKDDEDYENPILSLHFDTEEMKDKIKIFNVTDMRFDDVDLKNFDEIYNVHYLDTTKPFWKKYLPEIETEKSNEKSLKELE